MEISSRVRITTTEMHTCGDPVRIVESGYPAVTGATIMDKRQFASEHLDALRKFIICEPRGHFDMYGVVKVSPDIPEAHIAVLFIHSSGYTTMCGHACIALGRYAVDKGLVAMTKPETKVNIQAPCGLVETFVDCTRGKAGRARFISVPAFVFALDVPIVLTGFGTVHVDIGYGGGFYAMVEASKFGFSVPGSKVADITEVAKNLSDAISSTVKLSHPDHPGLAYLSGLIFMDDNSAFQDKPTANICVYGDKQVCRAPCGSGVTVQLAVQYKRGVIGMDKRRVFRSGIGSEFTGRVIRETTCGDFNAVVAEVAAEGFYTGSCVFTAEEADPLRGGFLMR